MPHAQECACEACAPVNTTQPPAFNGGPSAAAQSASVAPPELEEERIILNVNLAPTRQEIDAEYAKMMTARLVPKLTRWRILRWWLAKKLSNLAAWVMP